MLVTGPSTDANRASGDQGPEDVQRPKFKQIDEVWDINVRYCD